jgi:hypothetical protein
MEGLEAKSTWKYFTVGGAKGERGDGEFRFLCFEARGGRGGYTWILQVLHIHYSDLDAPLGQHLYDVLADAITASRHDDDLLAPVIRVVGPIVHDGIVEEVAYARQDAHCKREPEIPEGGGMLGG